MRDESQKENWKQLHNNILSAKRSIRISKRELKDFAGALASEIVTGVANLKKRIERLLSSEVIQNEQLLGISKRELKGTQSLLSSPFTCIWISKRELKVALFIAVTAALLIRESQKENWKWNGYLKGHASLLDLNLKKRIERTTQKCSQLKLEEDN